MRQHRARNIAGGLLILAIVSIGLLGCKEKSHKGHWSYKGDTGPSEWSKLEDGFASCGIGKAQSPIDIGAAQKAEKSQISFHYSKTSPKIINNGHVIQVNLDPGNYIEIEKRRYDLLQFHFHTPAENTLNGKVMPMEIHLVHKDQSGALAVVGALVKTGSSNELFKTLEKNLPGETGKETPLGAEIDINNLLPEDRAYYSFAGSLTTPPCSEGVKWNVLKSPIELSSGQIEKFRSLFPDGNARPVQPLGERVILDHPDK